MAGSDMMAGGDVFGRRERTWAGVSVSVAVERIAEVQEWSSEQADPTMVVNLGGTTSRLEARLGKGERYLGAPTRGEMSVIPADTRFSGVYQGEIVRFADVIVSSSALEDAVHDERGGRASPLRASLGVSDPFLFGCVHELAQLIDEHDAQSELFGECIANSLKLHLLRRYSVDDTVTQEPRGLSAVALAKLQAYIAEHLDQPLTLEVLAAAVDAPVHRMVAAYRSMLRTSPARYVLAQRIRHARWLLAHSSISLAEVAYACGLSSQSHLTTAFRKATGITPAAFRQQFGSGAYHLVQAADTTAALGMDRAAASRTSSDRRSTPILL